MCQPVLICSPGLVDVAFFNGVIILLLCVLLISFSLCTFIFNNPPAHIIWLAGYILYLSLYAYLSSGGFLEFLHFITMNPTVGVIALLPAVVHGLAQLVWRWWVSRPAQGKIEG